jgi:hypothetical protein
MIAWGLATSGNEESPHRRPRAELSHDLRWLIESEARLSPSPASVQVKSVNHPPWSTSRIPGSRAGAVFVAATTASTASSGREGERPAALEQAFSRGLPELVARPGPGPFGGFIQAIC